MQTLILAFTFFGFSLGLVDYNGVILACVDNGQSGICIDVTLEISGYDCGPEGCESF